MNYLKNLLWGNIDFNDFDSGGKSCLDYMSIEFRFCTTLIMIPVYLSVIYLLNDKSNKIKYQSKSPSNLEYVFGYLSIIVYLYTLLMKAKSGATMFMLNPCHTLGLLQGIILVSKSTKEMRLIGNVISNLLFCCFSAILNPNTIGLDGIEIIFFHYEHWEVLLLNPIIILIGGRYITSYTYEIKTSIISSCFFGLYQRLVLFPISYSSLVNLNYTLCPSAADPFVPLLGKWYYLVSDYYLWFIGILITSLFHILYVIFNFIKKKL